jgi:hypothetical protein
MRIMLLTMYGENYKEIAGITVPVMAEYCERHGYSLSHIQLEDGNNYAFKKHERIEEIIRNNEADVIFYLDVDCLITRLDVKVEMFIDEKHSFYITEDVHELNGGALICKCNSRMRLINSIILDNRDDFDNEQNVINFFRNFYLFEKGMKILSHPSINSYRYDLYQEYPHIRQREQGHWHEGDFVLHVPGAAYQTRIDTLKNTTVLK